MKKLPPLVPPAPKPEPFPHEVCGLLGRAAKECAEITEAPIEFAISAGLATAAACVQRLHDVELRTGDSTPTSLFLVTVGQSGERKSAVNRKMMKPLLDVIDNQMAEYDDLMRNYDWAKEEYEDEQRKQKKRRAKSPEDSKSIALAMDRPVEPINPQMLINDFTQEGLMRALGTTPAILLSEDEGGAFVGGHSWGENQLKVMTFLSSLWGGEARHVARALDGRRSNKNRRASLNLMFQPMVAGKLIDDQLAREQGFLARILISHPPSKIGTRLRPRRDIFVQNVQCATGDREKWNAAIQQLASRKFSVDEQDNSIKNTVLKFETEAWMPLEGYYRDVEVAQGSDGAYCEVKSFASKSLEQACRIAAVLQKVDNPLADRIDLDHTQAGITVAEWFLKEAKRISANADTNSRPIKAQQLLDAIFESRGHSPFKMQDIYQGVGRRRGLELDAHRSGGLIRLLIDTGYVIQNGKEFQISKQYGDLHTAQTAQMAPA